MNAYENRRAENLPPLAFGGCYFVCLKLMTACGIEDVGGVCAASFAPKARVVMIEDVFERPIDGADPFRIEALWRTFTAAAIQASRTFR